MIGTNSDSTLSPPKPNLTWNDWLKTLVELFVRLFELCLSYLIYQPRYLCCSTFLGDHYSRLFFPIWTAIHFHQHLNFKKTKTSFSLSLFVCLSVSLSFCFSLSHTQASKVFIPLNILLRYIDSFFCQFHLTDDNAWWTEKNVIKLLFCRKKCQFSSFLFCAHVLSRNVAQLTCHIKHILLNLMRQTFRLLNLVAKCHLSQVTFVHIYFIW